MEIILTLTFLLIYVLIIFAIASLLFHFLIERRRYPEFRASREFRKEIFCRYIDELKLGIFDHRGNAEALAFFSIARRISLKRAIALGKEWKFELELKDLQDNQYKSLISSTVEKMARKDPKMMERLQSTLSERKRKDGFEWNIEWDSYLADMIDPDYEVFLAE